jgi:hypothetical protein
VRLLKKKFSRQAEILNNLAKHRHFRQRMTLQYSGQPSITVQVIPLGCSAITTGLSSIILPRISIRYYSLPLFKVVTLHQQNRNIPNPLKASTLFLRPSFENRLILKTQRSLLTPQAVQLDYPDHVFHKQSAL